MTDIHEALDRFRENSLEASRLQQAGKTVAGNRMADASHEAYVQLSGTEEGRTALRGLLDDPEMVIQIDVAGRLWPDPAAEQALQRWAETDDVRGKQAAFVLKYAGRGTG